ncbi:putative F-box protein At3g25750 [Lotus japonicus]|uniref:putative F-box protein At3g25750 n=1 Tax=Lotus japonicus TaxID=34305 RepID=UPI00258CAE92|nr:putative F-box protein At3g25750 [Lotus japonicus]
MKRDWAYLEAAALDLILNKLKERINHVSFSVVCRNWCSVAKLNHQNQQFRTNVLPMLMIPTKRSLYGIPGNKVYLPSSLSLPLPLISNKKICGSSHGWLALMEDGKYDITLINPFKNVAPIVLPPLNPLAEFYENNVNKVVLSVDPLTDPNDYMVAAIRNDHSCFAIIRAGQKNWTHVEDDDDDLDCYYTDITFYKGLAYVACRMDDIVSFNLHYLDDPSGRERIVPNIFYEDNYHLTNHVSDRGYLVKSLEGDLWIVRRILDIQLNSDVRDIVIERFDVYKLELDAQNGEVLQTLKLENLGDNVLFVGDCDSTAVSSSYFSNCLQKDSIYYTNDYDDGLPSTYLHDPFDLRVKEGRFIQHCPFNPLSPTFWILPPFQF